MLSTGQLERRMGMRAAGIDVGKANLDLAFDGDPGVARFANNRAGIAKLVKRLVATPGVRWSS